MMLALAVAIMISPARDDKDEDIHHFTHAQTIT